MGEFLFRFYSFKMPKCNDIFFFSKMSRKRKTKNYTSNIISKGKQPIFTDWQARHIVVPNNLFLLPTNDVVLIFNL